MEFLMPKSMCLSEILCLRPQESKIASAYGLYLSGPNSCHQWTAYAFDEVLADECLLLEVIFLSS